MKHSALKRVVQIGQAVLFSVLMLACDDTDDNAVQSDTQNDAQTSVDSKSSVVVASTTQEVISVTSDAMNSNGSSNGGRSASGRTSGSSCDPDVTIDYSVNTNDKDSVVHQGAITIDYGDGSSCSGSTVRKGKMVDDFKAVGIWKDRELNFTTDETITLNGYYLDSAQVDGVIVSSSKSGESTSSVEAKNAKITYADGTTLSWSGTYTYTSGDDSTEMTGTWTGTNRKGEAFTAKVTQSVVYKYNCKRNDNWIPVSGKIEEKTGDKVSIIDYGDGTCDNVYTITADGKTVEYTFD